MAGLDEGVEKLQAFCGVLAQVNDGLRGDASALEAQDDAWQRAEDDLDDAFEELGQAVGAFRTQLEQGEEAAARGLELAAGSGHRLGEGLEHEQKELASSGEAFAERIGAQESGLEAGFTDVQRHFESVEHSLAQVDTDLDAADSRAQAESASLDSALDAMRQEVEGAATQATEDLQEAAEALADVAQGVEEDGERTAAGWEDELTSVMDEACSTTAESVEAAYGDLRSGVESAGVTFATAVAALSVEQAGLLRDTSEHELEDSCRLTEESMMHLVAYLSAAFVESGATVTVALLDHLNPDLARAKAMMPAIDQLLAALGQ